MGIAPGRTEMQTGKPFSGVSGKLLDGLLAACGWPRERTYSTNLICHWNDEPTPEEIMACWPRLVEELSDVRPRLIVPLGMIATQQFIPDRKFGTVRGTLTHHERFDAMVMPTYHPAAILNAKGEAGYSIVRDIVRDLLKIPTWLGSGANGFPNPHVEWSVLTSRMQVLSLFDSLPRNRPIALDVETFNPKSDEDEIDVHTDDLLCLAVSDGDNTYVITPDLLEGVAWPNVQWTGHFSIFDKQAVFRRFGVNVVFAHDTLNMSYCLDERSGVHRLKPLTREYQGAGFYEETLKKERNTGKLHQVDMKQVMEYNALDTAYTAREANRMLPLIKADGTEPVYDILMQASDVFACMQYHGVYVNVERLNDLALEWLPLWLQKEEHLQDLYKTLMGGDADAINLNSPKQLSAFLFGRLKLPGGPSTAESVLEALKDEHPFIERLLDFREMDKLIGTYINGVRDDIKRTGRIHPTPKLHGTNTGRLSYTDPPVQTIPRPFVTETSNYGHALRKLFTAKDADHVIIEADLKQAEVWCAWFYSQDPQMLEDLQTGDFHTNSAAFITNKAHNLVTKSERSDAKRTTFGQFFRIGAPKLAKQIKKPVAEARQWQQRWGERYARYTEWTHEVFKAVQEAGEQRTVVGRVQRYPYIFDTQPHNKIVNFPIQSTSHDILLAAIIELYWPLRRTFDAHILLDVHDAMLVECPRIHAMEAARMIHSVLTKPRFGLPSIPAEIKIGYSWGEAEEIDIAA